MAALRLAVLLIAVVSAQHAALDPTQAPPAPTTTEASGGAETTVVTTTETATWRMAANAAAGTSIEALGRSGRFTVYSTGAGQRDPNKVVVGVEALREVDVKGRGVGTRSTKKHFLQTFAAQEFTFGLPEEVEAGTAPASKVSLISNVRSLGNLKLSTYILTGAGAVGPKDDAWEARAGDFKWSIELSSWSWCGCSYQGTEEYGVYLDLDISVKGIKDTIEAAAASKNTFDLGGGVIMELTNKIEVDGVATEMPAGYPRLETRGELQVFVLRFPKFSQSVVYDPLLRMSGSESFVRGVHPVLFVSHGAGLVDGHFGFVMKAIAFTVAVRSLACFM